MKIISGNDILQNVSVQEMIRAMEHAFHIQKENAFSMPPRSHIESENGVLLIMPCVTDTSFSAKFLSTFPGNKEIGKPTTIASLLLNDARTGEPKALINGTVLTGIRTGALGGVAADYLAREDAASLCIVGAGTQGVFQALSAAAVRPIKDIWVYDSYLPSLLSYADRIHAFRPDLNIHMAASGDEAAAHADMIVTCSTAAAPVFSDDPALFKDKHITAIGSYQPQTRELSRSAVENAVDIRLDTMYALEESGDLIQPMHEGWLSEGSMQPFCDLVAAGKEATSSLRNRQTLFKSVGIGLFDLIAAELILQKADAVGFGVEVAL